MTRITAYSTPVIPKSETSVMEEEILSYNEQEKIRSEWKNIIDHKLIEWGWQPEIFEEEGLVAILCQIISEACEFCDKQASRNTPAPLSVVPNGDGGIVFEWKEGSYFRTIEFLADGSKEDCRFIDSKLKDRQRF